MNPELPSSPYYRSLAPYPFSRLDDLRAAVEARGVQVIDLGMGDPREPTPEVIRRAYLDALPTLSPYPRVVGSPRLRETICTWVRARFGVDLDPDTEVLPTNGSKEVIHSLPAMLVDPATRPLVMVPDPGYPVYALGVKAAGGTVHPLPLREENGFLADLESIPESVWRRTSLCWLNYPGNPTGAVAGRGYLERAAELCRQHGVVLASDEAYTEIYFGERPAGAIEAGTANLLILQTLSKRSGMAGFRSGFLAGDRRLIAMLKKIRPGLGVATPEFVQRTAVAAWSDENHVVALRERFRERRDVVVPGLRELGYRVPDVQATLYVWFPVPQGETSGSFSERCLDRGVVLLPGSAMGPSGEGYVRLSLSGSLVELQEALARLPRASV